VTTHGFSPQFEFYCAGGVVESLGNIAIASCTPLASFETILDTVNHQIRSGRIAQALDEFIDDLFARRGREKETWPTFARTCLDHPLREILHQDPLLTAHSPSRVTTPAMQ
jgi:hypothetical protein